MYWQTGLATCSQGCNIVWTYLKLTFFFLPQTKENDELTKICDDLILKMEKN